MAIINSLLAAIVSEQMRMGLPVVDLLYPGARANDISKLESCTDYRLPKSILELYSCHNGTDLSKATTIGRAFFFPGFYWLSIDSVIRHYSSMLSIIDPVWNPAWLPIFGTGTCDCLVVDLSKEQSDDRPIIDYINDMPGDPVIFDGILPMLQTILDCFKNGAFYVDPNGMVTSQSRIFAHTAGKNNPCARSYWLTNVH